MFKIKYRIVDDFEVLNSITVDEFDKEHDQILGYFRICFGIHQEGSCYHENPLADDEEGDELLDYWIDKMLKILILLGQGFEYAAFREIETVDRWLEFRREEEIIFINVAAGEAHESLLITEKPSFSS